VSLTSTDTLRAILRDFMDSSPTNSATFDGFPLSEVDAAARWADAIETFTAALVPVTTTGAVARTALQAGLLGMSAPGAGIVIFNAAFAAWATSIVVGMLPAFVGTPPPLPIAATGITFATLFADGVAGSSAFSRCNAMTQIINTWVRTGTATPSGGGSAVPWS
jgi:hypothetical protein